MQWTYFLEVTASAILAPLLFVILNNTESQDDKITAGSRLAGWVLIVILAFIPQYRFAFYNFGSQIFLMLPGPRTQLDAPSAAVENNQNRSDKAISCHGGKKVSGGRLARNT